MMWKLLLLLCLYAGDAAVMAPAPSLKLKYQRIDKTKTDVTRIECRLELVNKSVDPLSQVRLSIEEKGSATLNRDWFDFGELLPNRSLVCGEVLVFTYDHSQEPPKLIWVVTYTNRDGLQVTTRLE